MPAVITIDQRSSRTAAANRAADWVETLNRDYRDQLLRPFTVTLGDEIQAVTMDPRAAVDIVLRGVRQRTWWLGLGLGAVETPMEDTAARSRGPAFYNARDAVEAAKSSHHGFAIRADRPGAADEIQTVLELLAFLIRRRGEDPKRWRAVELAQAGESTVRIGRALEITQQAASKRLRNAGVDEEIAGRRLVERMITSAMEVP